jgi:hypothetical protein
MLAWQRVQPVVFGPIVAGARASVISCFPTAAASSRGN